MKTGMRWSALVMAFVLIFASVVSASAQVAQTDLQLQNNLVSGQAQDMQTDAQTPDTLEPVLNNSTDSPSRTQIADNGADSDDALSGTSNESKKRSAIAETGTANEFPVIEVINPTKTGLKITFSAVSGAVYYRVFLQNGDTWKKLGDAATTLWEHKNLTPGSYTYTVRAMNASKQYISAFDPQGKTARFLKTPVISKIENVFGGQKISWKASSGAQLYRVYVKNTDDWKSLGTTDRTSFVNRDVNAGKAYVYTVRCISDDGTAQSSYEPSKSVRYVAAPLIKKIENQKTGSKIIWSSSKGAVKYRVFLKKGASWKKLGDAKTTSFIHKNLTDQAVYTYTIRALDSAGRYVSGFDPEGKTNRFLSAPAITSIEKTGDALTLRWKAVKGVTHFRVYRKEYGADWQKAEDVSATTFTDATAPRDMPYLYTIRCLDENLSPISSYVMYPKYFCNGAAAEGTKKIGSKSVYFRNGVLFTGYRTVNNKKYYYKSGVIQKNGIVGTKKAGYYLADKNGVCCVSDEIRLAVNFLMNECKGSTLTARMKYGFLYMAKRFPYQHYDNHPKTASRMPSMAIQAFTNRRANCFRYAAAFACVARAAGYRARVGIGYTGIYPHGWAEVLVGGRWLICDVDAQIPSYHVRDYKAYMMRYHYWPLAPTNHFEVSINSSGKAVWK